MIVAAEVILEPRLPLAFEACSFTHNMGCLSPERILMIKKLKALIHKVGGDSRCDYGGVIAPHFI
jgi:hypothetical protein